MMSRTFKTVTGYISRMAKMAREMLKDTINAFIDSDVDLANEVRGRDTVVDQLNSQIFRERLTYIIQDLHNVESG